MNEKRYRNFLARIETLENEAEASVERAEHSPECRGPIFELVASLRSLTGSVLLIGEILIAESSDGGK